MPSYLQASSVWLKGVKTKRHLYTLKTVSREEIENYLNQFCLKHRIPKDVLANSYNLRRYKEKLKIELRKSGGYESMNSCAIYV